MRKTIVIATSLLVIVIGLELLFRITNLGMPWNMDQFGRRASSGLISSFKTDIVVTTGDSLTFGMRVRENDSYPSQLEGKFLNHQYSVVNTGISGHTSTQLKDRLARDVISYTPKILVLWIGTNDGMLKSEADPTEEGQRPFDYPPFFTKSSLLTAIDSTPASMEFLSHTLRNSKNLDDLITRVSIEEFKTNVQSIVKEAIKKGIQRTMIIGIPKIPASYSDQWELLQRQRLTYISYNEVLRHIARNESATFIDLWDQLSEAHFLEDGLHLNSEGYEIVALQVYRHIISKIDAQLKRFPVNTNSE